MLRDQDAAGHVIVFVLNNSQAVRSGMSFHGYKKDLAFNLTWSSLYYQAFVEI